ncbi:hypothetical protein FDECE_757 [Fusarium decemcellulare]|nr:hypothetical protein FDECE_757 [Fusarium decemcellulare]
MTDTTTNVNMKAYHIDGHYAPDHCETCNVSVPGVADRREHMVKTRHRRCLFCDSYYPLAGWADHCETRHLNEPWNDHMVYSQDAYDMREGKAQVWAQEAIKNKGGNA